MHIDKTGRIGSDIFYSAFLVENKGRCRWDKGTLIVITSHIANIAYHIFEIELALGHLPVIDRLPLLVIEHADYAIRERSISISNLRITGNIYIECRKIKMRYIDPIRRQ